MTPEQEGQRQQPLAPNKEPPEDGFGAEVFEVLREGKMGACHLLPSVSNYTFITSLCLNDKTFRVVYKPKDGEAPLWDFPGGTLYKREYAAYLLSEELGWHFVPPTVIRGGNYGVGAVQLFIPSESGSNYAALLQRYPYDFQRVAVFDLVVNNADRKAGHCLKGTDGRIWGIDHGLTFHQQPKLRTVIWDFAQQPIPPKLLDGLRDLAHRLAIPSSEVVIGLSQLLSREEMTALTARVEALLADPWFPAPYSYRDLPWPPV